MEYFREELFPCVSLTAVQTDKFKTGCMTAYLLTQLHRETAAENAVLKKEEKPSGGKNDWMKQYL